MKRAYKIEALENAIMILPHGSAGLDMVTISLTKYLTKKGYEGKVYFDSLIYNGLSEARFIIMEFHNNHFDYLKAKQDKLNSSLRELSDVFYFKHQDYIEKSPLSNLEKKQITTYLYEANLETA